MTPTPSVENLEDHGESDGQLRARQGCWDQAGRCHRHSLARMLVEACPRVGRRLLTLPVHSSRRNRGVCDVAKAEVHSTSELVDRAVRAGLVTRRKDPSNASIVRIALTPLGGEKLRELSYAQELAELGPTIRTLWRTLEQFEKNRSGG